MGYENYQEIFDLIKRGNDLAFLIGAGCSYNPLSNLPTGKLMMEGLIEYFCYEPVQNDLLTLLYKDKIRFENFIELVQNNFDPKLKILEFYSNCKSPNKNHLFLANKIINGNEFFFFPSLSMIRNFSWRSFFFSALISYIIF